MPPFDQADLQSTAERIRSKLAQDEEALALLQQLLDNHEATAELWQEQLSEITSGQSAIAKAVIMVAKQQSKMQAQMADLRKGLVSLHKMTKSQTKSTGKVLTKGQSFAKSQGTSTTPTEGMSLAAAERLGTLAKTIHATFGSSGGHQFAYNPALASKMILEGTLSPKQHQTWKRSNRLHDDPYQALQRRKVG